jgi:hypothetical protein
MSKYRTEQGDQTIRPGPYIPAVPEDYPEEKMALIRRILAERKEALDALAKY